MSWKIDNDKQIHPQLVDEIIRRIIIGLYKPGDKIPSVRDFAMEAKVNPNTMQKALVELEQKKIIETHRTIGKFVTKNIKVINNIKEDILRNTVSNFIKQIKDIDVDKKSVIKIIESEFKK